MAEPKKAAGSKNTAPEQVFYVEKAEAIPNAINPKLVPKEAEYTVIRLPEHDAKILVSVNRALADLERRYPGVRPSPAPSLEAGAAKMPAERPPGKGIEKMPVERVPRLTMPAEKIPGEVKDRPSQKLEKDAQQQYDDALKIRQKIYKDNSSQITSSRTTFTAPASGPKSMKQNEIVQTTDKRIHENIRSPSPIGKGNVVSP